jgi:hypothetical protein
MAPAKGPDMHQDKVLNSDPDLPQDEIPDFI